MSLRCFPISLPCYICSKIVEAFAAVRTPDEAHTYSKMNFAAKLLGEECHALTSVPLPETWDDLLDWTEDAMIMSTKLFSGRNDSCQEFATVRIYPLILSEARKEVENLASMPYVDRAKFFAEKVSTFATNGNLNIFHSLTIILSTTDHCSF
jgi:hypothetical protein